MNERPECDYCGHEIVENRWYEINGDVICKGCLNENFLKGEEVDDE